jgi:hypothetical protein
MSTRQCPSLGAQMLLPVGQPKASDASLSFGDLQAGFAPNTLHPFEVDLAAFSANALTLEPDRLEPRCSNLLPPVLYCPPSAGRAYHFFAFTSLRSELPRNAEAPLLPGYGVE